MGVDSLKEGTVVGAYRIGRPLGSGQFGAVYEATNQSGQLFAIKCLHPAPNGQWAADLLARFDREGSVCRTLDNPHIVRVEDHGIDAKVGPYLIMRLLRGANLQAWLGARAPLSPRSAVTIALQICQGLFNAHTRGVIHRDLKPENVFLDDLGDGRLSTVVCDFGLAKICDESGKLASEGLTASGAFLGTPYYMSPEQLIDSKRVDARCDVWAAAMVLYHALAGSPALGHAKTFSEVVLALGTGVIPPLAQRAPWVSPQLANVVHGALLPIDQRSPSIQVFSRNLANACPPFEQLTSASITKAGGA